MKKIVIGVFDIEKDHPKYRGYKREMEVLLIIPKGAFNLYTGNRWDFGHHHIAIEEGFVVEYVKRKKTNHEDSF